MVRISNFNGYSFTKPTKFFRFQRVPHCCDSCEKHPQVNSSSPQEVHVAAGAAVEEGTSGPGWLQLSRHQLRTRAQKRATRCRVFHAPSLLGWLPLQPAEPSRRRINTGCFLGGAATGSPQLGGLYCLSAGARPPSSTSSSSSSRSL